MTKGLLTLKLEFAAGGAISWINFDISANLVNAYDQGRYIQQSYYTGKPIDRTSEGQSSAWSPWPWNPIQSGDAFHNLPMLLDSGIVDDTVFYVKTSGLQWDMNNEVPECTIEQWVTFENDRTIKVLNTFTSFRTDTIYGTLPRHQELPAVYTVGRLNHLVSYEGTSPWINDAITERTPLPPPWDYWTPTENWAAYINDNDFGLGVYYEDAELFIGGFAGDINCNGGANDGCTGYISPLRTIELQKVDSIDYTYYLSIGFIDDIRKNFYTIKGINLNATSTIEP